MNVCQKQSHSSRWEERKKKTEGRKERGCGDEQKNEKKCAILNPK